MIGKFTLTAKKEVKHPKILRVLEPRSWNSTHRWCEAKIDGMVFLIRKPISAIKHLMK